MYFLIGLLIFNVMVLGSNFCFLLIGGTPFHKGVEFDSVHLGQRTYTVERFAVGVSISVLGLSWLLAWVYFLITGWESFLAQFSAIAMHVALQLISAIALTVAGIGIFKQWKRAKGIFLTSLIILVWSIVSALVIHGPRGHGTPIFMYLFGAWTLVVGGVLTTATYLLDRLLHEKD